MLKNLFIPLFLFSVLSAILFFSCSREDEVLVPIPMTEQFAQDIRAYNIYEGEYKDLIPASDFHVLELNASLFSNYAKKQRLVKLPIGTQMTENGNGIPVFPDGTILVKTFYYFKDARNEALGKQVIETRLLIKSQGLWNVATYVWNDSQTNASLDLNGFDKQVSWIDNKGSQRTITYHFPDQNECISCHQVHAEVFPIGPALRNLNIDINIDDLPTNQLAHLQSLGMLNDFDINQISHIQDYDNTGATLSERGRAYLDMNCAHCHNPAGWSKTAQRSFDFRYETSINNTGILDKKDEIKNVLLEGEMPFLGTTIIDEEGVDLVIAYINSL